MSTTSATPTGGLSLPNGTAAQAAGGLGAVRGNNDTGNIDVKGASAFANIGPWTFSDATTASTTSNIGFGTASSASFVAYTNGIVSPGGPSAVIVGNQSSNVGVNIPDPVPMNATQYDGNSAYNTSTYTYTVPLSGMYLISFGASTTSATDSTNNITIYVNGSAVARFTSVGNGLVTQVSNIVLSLTAGDTVTQQLAGPGGQSSTFFIHPTAQYTRMQIHKLF